MTLEEKHREHLAMIWDALFRHKAPEAYGFIRESLVILEPILSNNPNAAPYLGGFDITVKHPKNSIFIRVGGHSEDSINVFLLENLEHAPGIRTVFSDGVTKRELAAKVQTFIDNYFHMMRLL